MIDIKESPSGKRWQPPPEGVLDIYSIYEVKERPLHHYVVCRYFCRAEGVEQDPLSVACSSLREAREVIRQEAARGVELIPPMPGDDPDMVETWI